MKRTLLCASALCGSLILVQPAQAACTTSTDGQKTVTCTGDTPRRGDPDRQRRDPGGAAVAARP
ncbi:MAG: hypothetical protein LCH74_13495, partial [Proteobacteria bacterium]|nr:hypothetical protein [Pseudomonadota bacterium]